MKTIGLSPLLESKIIEVLKTIYDPEISISVYEMGMIYNVEQKSPGEIYIAMTLTSPNCPVAGSLPSEVEQKVRAIADVAICIVKVVWDPPWTQEMMSDEARLSLNLM